MDEWTGRQAGRQADVTMLIVTFRNFANSLEKESLRILDAGEEIKG
jgi:hypothetical protein